MVEYKIGDRFTLAWDASYDGYEFPKGQFGTVIAINYSNEERLVVAYDGTHGNFKVHHVKIRKYFDPFNSIKKCL